MRIFDRSNWLNVVIGILAIFGVVSLIHFLRVDSEGMWGNLTSEVVGILFTVVILDRLSQVREERQVVETLVTRAHSRYHHVTREALEELRAINRLQWIQMETRQMQARSLSELRQLATKSKSGALNGRELRGSNWQDANLYQADLRNCDLRRANLFKADLVQVNLEGANVDDVQLAACDILLGAIMPDGTRYNGKFNLAGERRVAREWLLDVRDDIQMAQFFGVTLDEYLKGQIYWRENKDRFKVRSESYDLNDSVENLN